MRAIFVNRFFHPDQSATSQLASDLAFALASRGMEVVAITSRQRCGDARAALAREELVGGVRVLRVRTPTFGRAGLAGRALDYAGFYLGSAWRLLRIARRGDVVVAMTDPPLLGAALLVVVRLRGARLVNWLQDLFPEIAEQLGVRAIRAAARPLRWLRNAALRGAVVNVAIGETMARFVELQSGRSLEVIPNWALEEGGGDALSQVAHPLRAAWGLGDAFIVGYSGNMGRAHELQSLIEAAALLQDQPQIAFVLVGDGAQRLALEQAVSDRDLANVHFRPYQARDGLRLSLTLPDIHFVSLDARLEGLAVPSKFVGVIALGKPVLWMGAADGELGTLVRASAAGVVVPAGDVTALAHAIAELASNAGRVEELAVNASALWQRRFRRVDALDHWHRLLAGIMAA